LFHFQSLRQYRRYAFCQGQFSSAFSLFPPLVIWLFFSQFDFLEINQREAALAKKTRKRRPVSTRKTTVTIQGNPTKRGEKMLNGRYRLVNADTKRVFVGTLIDTINKGKVRIAIFSVPKG
jgi:hypothetical protein